MNQKQLLRAVLQGELVLVGELRGVRAEDSTDFDKSTGQGIASGRAIYLIERLHSGMTVTMTIYQKFPDFATAEEICARYERGKRYAFFLEGLRRKGPYWTGSIGERNPKPIGAQKQAPGRRAVACP